MQFRLHLLPVGRTEGRSDKQKSFGELAGGLRELELLLNKYEADVVSLNSKGEALLNANVEEYIDFIKAGEELSVWFQTVTCSELINTD
jgi:hypothetical protein